ncbi:MAG: hypothetical protein QM669_13240 [Siphonobacter sp.]
MEKRKMSARRYSVRLVLILLLSLPAFFAFRFLEEKHDFHNSLTEMRYNVKTKSFEVEIKVFTNDLETVLEKGRPGTRIHIQDNDKNDRLIEAYIRKHFKLINPQGTAFAYQYVGKQNELDATWVFLELPSNGVLKGCKLEQSTFVDIFDDQQNIVNLTIGADKKYFLFNEKLPIRPLD